MIIVTVALLITLVLLLLAIYLIYLQPPFLINFLVHRYPDIVWRIPTNRCAPSTTNNKAKTIVLTIDDSPLDNTIHILSILRKHSATATFFVVGSHVTNLARGRGVLEDIVRDECELGNHGLHDHPAISLAPAELRCEIGTVDVIIDHVYESCGVMRRGKWFRPGSGWFNCTMRKVVKDMGYRLVLGDVYPHDAQIWCVRLNAWHVLRGVRMWERGGRSDGSVVVVHDRAWTGGMLDWVLRKLGREGWRVVSLGEAMSMVEFEHSKEVHKEK